MGPFRDAYRWGSIKNNVHPVAGWTFLFSIHPIKTTVGSIKQIFAYMVYTRFIVPN